MNVERFLLFWWLCVFTRAARYKLQIEFAQ